MIQAVPSCLTCHYDHTLEDFSYSKHYIFFSQATDITHHPYRRSIQKFTVVVEEGIKTCI